MKSANPENEYIPIDLRISVRRETLRLISEMAEDMGISINEVFSFLAEDSVIDLELLEDLNEIEIPSKCSIDDLKNALLKKNKKILIKPHPNFYNGSLGQSAKWDKIIYDKFVKRFSNNDNLFFLNKPTQNYHLLKKLNIISSVLMAVDMTTDYIYQLNLDHIFHLLSMLRLLN